MAETKSIILPDVGDFDDIEVIEVLISAGDSVSVDDSILTLESDKATMEIPCPFSGVIQTVTVSVGDRISEGHEVASIEVSDGDSAPAQEAEPEVVVEAEKAQEAPVIEEPPAAAAQTETAVSASPSPSGAEVPGKMIKPHPGAGSSGDSPSTFIHASPSIRRYARELGVDLEKINGSGPKGRILKEDVKSFIKASMSQQPAKSQTSGGLSVPAAPQIDFSKFGEVETRELSRIKKISGTHLHRSWVTVPHVTQFDEADITDLEAFRKSLAKEAEKRGVKLTMLIFLMKAVVKALQEFPEFNASLDASAENLILKKYFHIGVAVDTPNGLMVPVIRNVDQKGLFDLAEEVSATAERARNGKLMPADLQGGCFSISSLGGIGGTQFTPIVNAPEVAILGVARSKMQPQYVDEDNFDWRLMLPLALSYDHRVIDGAAGARFTGFLSRVITDMRRILL